MSHHSINKGLAIAYLPVSLCAVIFLVSPTVKAQRRGRCRVTLNGFIVNRSTFEGAIDPNGWGDDIWVMDADGCRPTNITHSSDANEGDPVWSREGRRIAFVKNPVPGGLNVWTMNPDGSGQTPDYSDQF